MEDKPKRRRSASKAKDIMPLVIAGLVLVAGVVGVVMVQRAARDRAEAERLRIAEERALAAEKPAPVIYVVEGAPAAPAPKPPVVPAPAPVKAPETPLERLQAALNPTARNEVVDAAYVAATRRLFDEVSARLEFKSLGYANVAGERARHDRGAQKIEAALRAVETNARMMNSSHDAAILVRDSAYSALAEFNVWECSVKHRDGSTQGEQATTGELMRRFRFRLMSIQSAAQRSVSKFTDAAADAIEESLSQPPPAPIKPANACDWCGAENGERKLIKDGPAKGLRLCARCRQQ